MKLFLASLISIFFKTLFSILYREKIQFGKNILINHKFKFRGPGKLILHDNVNLWAHKEPNEFLTFAPEAAIEIGSGSRINGAIMQSKKKISIGENCLIGSCQLIDTDFHSIYADKRNNPNFIKTKEIKIGNKVWLAGQSAILKGVIIGDEAVIGFRAVVTKDVPAKSVAVGNPAQIVKHIEKEKESQDSDLSL